MNVDRVLPPDKATPMATDDDTEDEHKVARNDEFNSHSIALAEDGAEAEAGKKKKLIFNFFFLFFFLLNLNLFRVAGSHEHMSQTAVRQKHESCSAR